MSEQRPIWGVDRDGLRWRSDWFSAPYLAGLLSGEDDGRVPAGDVEDLLAVLAAALDERP